MSALRPVPAVVTSISTLQAIVQHPRLGLSIRRQASTLLSIQAVDPRLAAVFATQQRWLIAHIGLALHFENTLPGAAHRLRASTMIEAVLHHRVASANTADAFVKEMLRYGYLVVAPATRDRRIRSLAVAPVVVETLRGWLYAHLSTLDALDDGGRLQLFRARPELLSDIHPRIAAGLLGSPIIREPAPAFSLFTWLNEGGVVMDWLCSGLEEVAPDCSRIPTKVTSYADLGGRIRLSRSHLTRKLRLAEEMGSLGWMGERGRSTMWVSSSFLEEYHLQQAAKLAIIEVAFQQTIATDFARSSAQVPPP